MPGHKNKKMYTLRHFFFYLGVAAVLGAAVGAAKSLLDWSDGLTFAVGIVAATISCTMAVREDLFAPPRHSRERRNHHV
jgi:thiamine monophosphate kinase